MGAGTIELDLHWRLSGTSISSISPYWPKISRRWSSVTFLVNRSTTICSRDQQLVIAHARKQKATNLCAPQRALAARATATAAEAAHPAALSGLATAARPAPAATISVSTVATGRRARGVSGGRAAARGGSRPASRPRVVGSRPRARVARSRSRWHDG